MLSQSLATLIVIFAFPAIGWILIYAWRSSSSKDQDAHQAPHPPFYKWDLFDIRWMLKMLVAATRSTLHDLEQATFDQLSRERGAPIRTFGFNRAGEKLLHTMDPVLINAILVRQFNDFVMGRRLKYFEPLLGEHSILTVDGASWKNSRGRIRPALTRERVSDLQIISKHTDKMLQGIIHGEIIDIQEASANHAIHTAMEFLNIVDDTEVLGDTGRNMRSSFEYAQSVLMRRLILGRLYWAVDSLAFRATCATCHKVVDEQIKRAVARLGSISRLRAEELRAQGKLSLMEDLILSGDEPAKVRAIIIGLLIAAGDNLAAATAWTLYFLARDPAIFDQLRQEIISRFGTTTSSDILAQDLKTCTFMQYCIKEFLRLEPPVTRGAKTAVRDTWLPRGGGYDGTAPLFVPKGTEIAWTLRQMHRDPLHYGADAHEYKPERWATIHPGAEYSPFNAGPRRCLGETFAMTNLSYVLVRIAQKYERIELCDDNETRITVGFVGYKLNGIKMRFFEARNEE